MVIQTIFSALALALLAGCSGSPCFEGESRCGGGCINLQSDPGNCGECAVACSTEQVCSLGKCQDGCSSGLERCERSCVDLARDPRNCGVCGVVCGKGQTCQAGKCGGAPDGGPPGDARTDAAPVCNERVSLQTSGAYDVDLRTVTVSGRVTKNGKPVPDGSRGRITFANVKGGERRMATLSSTGEATYQGELFVGDYDLYYDPPSSCSEGGPLPCQRALLKSKQTIGTNGTLDLDLKIVAVSGRTTRNGQPVPDGSGSSRGAIAFALAEGSERRMPSFASTGEAAYQGEIFAGLYDIYYQSPSSCSEGGPLPCQRALLKSKQTIGTNGTLDLDLKIVAVSGRATRNGKPVPDGSYRGSIAFALAEGSERRMPSFSGAGEATYQGEIFAGLYDIYYQSPSSCSEGGPLPCQRALLKSKQTIGTNGTLDLDLKIVAVSGRATKNGKPVPDGSGSYRGAIAFALAEGSERRMPSFASTGEATYQGEIFAGLYDIYYQSPSSCSEEGPLPCQRALLKSKQTIGTNGTLDLDLKIVAVSGRATKNGKPVPDGSGSYRGAFAFALAEGSERRMPSFTASGEATYQGEIFAGLYDIYYQSPSACSEGGPLPCQRALLKSKQTIGTNGTLDLDLKIVAISGRATKNGKLMPDGSTSRGAIGFTLTEGSERRMPNFASTGEATYQGELFAGSYDIRYLPPSSCSEGEPLPCQTLLVAGCPAAATKP